MRVFLSAFSLIALAACSSSPESPTAAVADPAAPPKTPAATCEPKPPDPTRFPLDPVALANGAEIPGSDERVEQSGAYSYAFASAENQAAFRVDPARYEVQLGGACARMGPLSGDGNVTLHARHDGRLYLFASKACRAAFLKAPEKYLESDDPQPAPEQATTAARGQAMGVLSRAIDWMGGLQALDSVRTVSELRERDEKAGDRTYRVKNELQLDLEHGWARENECWDASCFGNVIGPRGAFRTGKESTAMAPVQRAAFERQTAHHLLAALRSRRAPDAVVYVPAPRASDADGERACTVVAIWSRGAETRIRVRDDDGSIAGIEHAGRAPNLTLATVRVDLEDWRGCGPIRLPFRRLVSSGEGEARTTSAVTIDSIVVDGALDPALFDG